MTDLRTVMLRLLLLVSLFPAVVQSQAHEAWREMNRPVEPFRIAGNLYYVGASSVAAFLVTTAEGHLLIDGGFADRFPFTALKVDRRLSDRDTVELGGVVLTAHVTAGHTRGCTSWSFEIDEGHAAYIAGAQRSFDEALAKERQP